MKKYIAIATALSLSLVVFTACTTTKEETTNDNNNNPGVTDNNNNPGMNDSTNNDINSNQATYQDGTYKAESKEFDNLYKHYVEITIKKGKIDKVIFDGKNETGKLKSEDITLKEEYSKMYQTTPQDIMGVYSDKLIETQTVDMVDILTGGENENKVFKKLANAALMNAQKGEKTTAIVDTNM